MNKGRSKLVKIFLSIFIFIGAIVGIVSVVADTDEANEPGRILIEKSATVHPEATDGIFKIDDDGTNKRFAEVKLSYEANPYYLVEKQPIDVVVVFDMSNSMKYGMTNGIQTNYNSDVTNVDCSRRSESCTVTDINTTNNKERLATAKEGVSEYINNLFSNNGKSDGEDYVHVGLVTFDSTATTKLNLTANSSDVTKEINDLSIDLYDRYYNHNNDNPIPGGTNIADAMENASKVLASGRNVTGRENAKQIVILVTDGEPTYFMYDGEIKGTGGSSNYSERIMTSERQVYSYTTCNEGEVKESEGSGWGRRYYCRAYKTIELIQETKNTFETVKKSNPNANIYGFIYGNEQQAKRVLDVVNVPGTTETAKYENILIDKADDLADALNKTTPVTEVLKENTQATITDVIPYTFSLTEESENALKEKYGENIEITHDYSYVEDGVTRLGTLISIKLDSIKAKVEDSEGNMTNPNEDITYVVEANKDYHGSMYTNVEAKLSATVKDNNPFYQNKDENGNKKVDLDYEMPAVDIPAITNPDSYKMEGYSSYEMFIEDQEQINGISVLLNDKDESNEGSLNDSLFNDKSTSNNSTPRENDKVKVIENEKTQLIEFESNENTSSYNIYGDDGNLQGVLVMDNNDGTFTFTPKEGYIGEVNFEYRIVTTNTNSNAINELEEVNSNISQVTLNVRKHELIDIDVIKVWTDNNDQDKMRPDEITVQLIRNDEPYLEQIVLNDDNEWSYSFTDLRKYKDDESTEYVYAVKEVKVDYYETNITSGTNTNGNKLFTIENTFENKEVSIKGRKEWQDNNDQDGKRKDITITLKNNAGLEEQTFVIKKDSTNLEFEFNNLKKYYNGKEVTYTVEELELEDYESVITKDKTTGEYVITNSHTPETIEVEGTKTWNDNNDQDGKRPESITVKLLADGEEYDSVQVTKEDKWSYSFTNLPKYKDGGKAISYTIKEDEVSDYQGVVDGYNITNTHTPEKISITGEKVWVDNNNIEGLRPTSIEIKLYANGKEVETKTITSKDKWIYEFTGLDKYSDGEEIEYTVEEVNVDEMYTASHDDDNKYIIVNTHDSKNVTYQVTKKWNDNNNNDGKRPESITVTLVGKVGSNEYVRETAVIKDNGTNEWTYTFKDLPEYREGKLISYTVTEEDVAGYSVEYEYNDYSSVITNSHDDELQTINITKTWEDDDNRDGVRPESITVELLIDGESTGETIELTSDKGWAESFTDLKKYSNGQPINYSVKEVKDANYDDTYESSEDGLNIEITNTHKSELVSFVIRKDWEDLNNQDGIRPESVTVRLLANGTEIRNATLSNDNNWTITFDGEDLYKFSNGELITYTVIEDEVDGYKANITNSVSTENENETSVVIVNKHEPEKAEIEIIKKWDDLDNKFNYRPDSITVDLYADGELIESYTITSEDDWKLLINDFYAYKDGKKITYTIKEHEVDKYYTSYDGFTITNKIKEIGGTDGEDIPDTGVGNNPFIELFTIISAILFGLTLSLKKRFN